MNESIETLWKDLMSAGGFPSHRRVSAEHPMDLYAAITADGRRGMLIISSEKPPDAPHYESVEIEIRQRVDGQWAMQLILARPDLQPLFTHLCNDLIETGNSFVPISQSGAFVLGRLAKWRRMLNLGSDDLLSDIEIRGLIGELLFLKTAFPVFGVRNSMTAWSGPYDAPQDFVFPDAAFEIKTVSPGDVAVRIGSLDQLDYAGDMLTLVVYALLRVNPNVTNGFTLDEIVSDLRSLSETEAGAVEEFDLKLRVAGYQEREEYKSLRYSLGDAKYYSVGGDFPCLVRSRLPHAVAEAKYSLYLSECESFRTEPFEKQ
jgi:hypothetical protein